MQYQDIKIVLLSVQIQVPNPAELYPNQKDVIYLLPHFHHGQLTKLWPEYLKYHFSDSQKESLFKCLIKLFKGIIQPINGNEDLNLNIYRHSSNSD